MSFTVEARDEDHRCPTEAHGTGRAIAINLKCSHDAKDSSPNASDMQQFNGKLTITIDLSGLLSSAHKPQEHAIGNRQLNKALCPQLEGGTFSTIAQYPLRTAPIIKKRPEDKFVAFENPFLSPPEVITGLNLLDCSNERTVRIKLSVENVTNSSFKLTASTWSDTRLQDVGCDWLAVHSLTDGQETGSYISTGMYSTREDQHWSVTIKHLVRPVRFQKSYHAAPTIVAWICGIDVNTSGQANLRVHLTITDVTTTGFNINVHSWLDTTLYSVDVSWLAYPPGLPGIESGVFGGLGGGYPGWQSYGLPKGNHEAEKTASLSGQVSFNKFWNLIRPPRRVLVGFTMLDLPNKNNFRLKLACEGVTKEGMVWRADSWGGSEFYGCSGAYIALA